MIIISLMMWACINAKFAVILFSVMFVCSLYISARLSFSDKVIAAGAPDLVAQRSGFEMRAIEGNLTQSERWGYFLFLFLFSFVRVPVMFAVICLCVSVVIYLVI